MEREREREREKMGGFFRMDGWMEGAGLVPMLLWTEWVSGGEGTAHWCFSLVAV